MWQNHRGLLSAEMSNQIQKKNVEIFAILVALGASIQIAESVIPRPLPWLRLGLANVITLIALYRYGWRMAIRVGMLRTVIGSLFLGTSGSPAFFLSFGGATISCIAMGIIPRGRSRNPARFGLTGVSVTGAVTHNLVQLALAWVLFIKHGGILWLAPVLMVTGVITGVITAQIAGYVLDGLFNRLAVPNGQDNSQPVSPGMPH